MELRTNRSATCIKLWPHPTCPIPDLQRAFDVQWLVAHQATKKNILLTLVLASPVMRELLTYLTRQRRVKVGERVNAECLTQKRRILCRLGNNHGFDSFDYDLQMDTFVGFDL